VIQGQWDEAAVQAVQGRLRNVAARMPGVVNKAVKDEALRVLTRVKLKLSDDVLKVRSGRLRRSITTSFTEAPTFIEAKVGTNVSYARVHELGFKGSVSVKAHIVKEHTRKMNQAFGRPIEPRRVTVREHVVSQHSKAMNIPARSFLLSSLTELQPSILNNIRMAMAKGLSA
jgi:phage gpG-like protein